MLFSTPDQQKETLNMRWSVIFLALAAVWGLVGHSLLTFDPHFVSEHEQDIRVLLGMIANVLTGMFLLCSAYSLFGDQNCHTEG